MAEINNYSEINENFDTIKTLLNAIRAQGILNTSDVDKLLGGINSKLEKINTEEDIDLIKAFLSELKQNLDERHNVLISKFGAIESLFSNLLKNSSDALKSNEVKELFDIVATNLSVFSREVVSQKETLTDITLRLDAMRSDDSQKKDIIKSISSLKTDVEHISNGFDSIVLSLNENFKTVLKSVSEIDQSSDLTQFGAQIADIVNSSNTILSALQVIDKKSAQIEEKISNLATHEDINSTKRSISELTVTNKELTNSVDTLNQKTYKIDNIAEKIDAAVNIIAGLKTVIADNDAQNTQDIIDRLEQLEPLIKEASSAKEFEALKNSLDTVIKEILNEYVLSFTNLGNEIKEQVTTEADKLSQLFDVNVTRTLNDISSNAETLNSRLKDTHASITNLCEKSFREVTSGLTDVREIISQLDENNVSANNAIFSNITDRLAIFENSLKNSLERQEDYVSNSSDRVIEQIENIKNLTGGLDYKIDSSVIEVNNAKQELSGLKSAISEVLALDFVNVVKDLRVDLYAVKQDLSTALESSTGDLSDKVTNDLFSKYELLISKLDNVEDEIKSVQTQSLSELKNILDKISSSIVDVLSYVSVSKNAGLDELDTRLADITEIVKENNLNYVENVRDIVDVIKVQVENNMKQLSKDTLKHVSTINGTIDLNSSAIKQDIQNSYNKIVELQDDLSSIKETIKTGNSDIGSNLTDVLSSASDLKNVFDLKVNNLNNELNIKVNDLKKNLDDLSEQFAGTSLKIDGTNKELFEFLKDDLNPQLNNSIDAIQSNVSDILSEIGLKVTDVVEGFEKLDKSVNSLSDDTKSSLSTTLAKILENFVALKSLLEHFNEQSNEALKLNVSVITREFKSLKDAVSEADNNIDEDLTRQLSIIEGNFEGLTSSLTDLFEQTNNTIGETIHSEFIGISEHMSNSLSERLSEYKNQLGNLFENLKDQNNEQIDFIKQRTLELNRVLDQTLTKQSEAAEVKLSQIADNLKNALFENIELTAADYNALKEKIAEYYSEVEDINNSMVTEIKTQLDDIRNYVDTLLQNQSLQVTGDFNEINAKMQKISDNIISINQDMKSKAENIAIEISAMKTESSEFIGSKASLIINSIKEVCENISTTSLTTFNTRISDLKNLIEGLDATEQNTIIENSKQIIDELEALEISVAEKHEEIKKSITKDIIPDIENLNDKISSLFEENSLNFITQLGNSHAQISEDIKSNATELKANFEQLNARLDKDEISQMNIYQSQLKELSNTFNVLINEAKNVTKQEVSTICETLIANSKAVFEDVDLSIEEKINTLLATSADISAGELQTIETFVQKILEQIEGTKQNTIVCKDIISNLVKEQIDIISRDIDKETDVIVGDVIEQFNLLKDSQKDELTRLTSTLEGSVQGYIQDSIYDIKSYLDVKTDSTIQNSKLDSLTVKMESITDDLFENLNKLLETSVFSGAITDLKTTNEVLIANAVEKINNSISDFVSVNVSKKLDDKLNLLDKKFVDTVVDKYEEIKLLTTKYNDSFENISVSVEGLISKFSDSKNEIKNIVKEINNSIESIDSSIGNVSSTIENIDNSIGNINSNIKNIDSSIGNINNTIENIDGSIGNIDNSIGSINNSVSSFSKDFAVLKAHIIDTLQDEELQTSINKQISGIESLINEQMGYISDINELCCNSLPEVSEMSTIVKYSIQDSVAELVKKVDTQDINIEKSLNQLKSDVITQFLNIFNQISFVAEQEEIIDFIQEKHSELITVLSHIVTTVDGLNEVDDKINSIKEDISLINEKITSIMSSSGDIDYVYSLQDLENDIANLRLVLNEMKTDNKSQEFSELIDSTNSIYKLVETIRDEMPSFEAAEFRKDFDNLAEDIVSISTRTNKLILASDESYKTLQDNLQDFKLVINDLDERTRNFAQESGLDRIDSKLGSINNMIQSGAKTNQVFNQVFEYLAEWVDNAGAQIAAISDKVETLDDIGQIKVMLEDLKAEAEDNTEANELIETLSTIFEKQAKKISSLEAKLDRIIVESTINNKNNKIDLKPFEDTLNRFLVAIDDKMNSQKDRMNAMETKLEEMVSIVDNKDTAQLTKKVGGMDRQLAKLNKSIEKIASNVVEK